MTSKTETNIRTILFNTTLTCFLLSFFPITAQAETVLRKDTSVSIETNQLVENDFYAQGQTITMSGEVMGDMYAIARSVTVNGQVKEDLSAAGLTVQIHASTSDDVRVVAGETVIAGPVGGDVFVIGGLLHILSSADVKGDVFFYGGEVEIEGLVGGSVMGTAENVRIDSAIEGSVDVTVLQSLVLGDQASVKGDVRYGSASDLNRGSGAIVEGEVIKRSTIDDSDQSSNSFIFGLVFSVFFAVLTAYLLFKNEMQTYAEATVSNFARTGLIGIAALVCVPIVCGLLFLVGLGSLLGIIGLFLFLLVFCTAFVAVNFFVAVVLRKMFTKNTEITLPWLLVSTSLIILLPTVPVAGAFTAFILFAIAFGGLWCSLYQVFS